MKNTTQAVQGDAPVCAYFDVDETLISVKSMFSFLEFIGAQRERPAWATATLQRLKTAAEDGLAREEINRLYYQAYTGWSWEDLLALGQQWYATVGTQPGFYLPSTLAALRSHQEQGHLITLVSGSFEPCLAPIAHHVQADDVLCTHLIRPNGDVLSGDIEAPVIAAGKADALRAHANRRGIDLGSCFAYGDHHSDIPMLSTVGHPRPVGTEPHLQAHATAHGWL